MKGSSKVIMGATMAVVIIVAIVLALVLVLLAELYCSLLFRRRKLNKATKPSSLAETPSISLPQQVQVSSFLRSFYSQGVLEAPRSFLFPKLPSKKEQRGNAEEENDDIEKQNVIASSSPSPSCISLIKPHQINHGQEPEIEIEVGNGAKGDDFIYISNPIYDNDAGQKPARADSPFEMLDSSPTRLDRSGFSNPSSLPLSPVKELPAKACCVGLRDGRCLGTSSECNSHIGRSSSSSGSSYTSPSW